LNKLIYTFKNSSLVFLLLLSSFLFGCNSEEEKKIEASEKQVAISFFNAIYNEKDADKAISLSTPNFQKELEQYHTAQNIAHRLFNMHFDSVSLHASLLRTKILDDFTVQVTMMVQFSGNRNGNIYKDYKKVSLIKEDNKWLMDRLIEQD